MWREAEIRLSPEQWLEQKTSNNLEPPGFSLINGSGKI